jgi:hypothetical protein
MEVHLESIYGCLDAGHARPAQAEGGEVVARLITIGDSISQGFMSGGAARPEVCYSTFIAEALGLRPGRDYHFGHWPLGGLPLNFEVLLRHLSKFFGDDVWGPFEWPSAAIRISGFVDKLEDYYERGAGDYRKPFAKLSGFHNLSSFGFTVSDAWEVTPEICLQELEPGGVRPVDDQAFGTPSDGFYRSAFRTLNPAADPKRMTFSQLDWLQHYAENDRDGVENLIVWLGANNALGTILDLKINKTPSADDYKLLKHLDKGGFNLWARDLFKLDYGKLLERICEILSDKKHTKKQPDWRVFVATVPAITIAPLAKGVGSIETRDDPFKVLTRGAAYFEHYTYMIFEQDAVLAGDVGALTREQAYEIDTRISEFNEDIDTLVKEQNGKLDEERICKVDIGDALLRLALKRNRGSPTYELPDALKPGGKALVDTRYYDAEGDRMTAGGIFSLDGVHPSVIGQGLIAHEFLKVMKEAGRSIRQRLDWDRIMRLDDLFSRPVDMIQEIYQHDQLARLLVRWLRTPDTPA